MKSALHDCAESSLFSHENRNWDNESFLLDAFSIPFGKISPSFVKVILFKISSGNQLIFGKSALININLFPIFLDPLTYLSIYYQPCRR